MGNWNNKEITEYLRLINELGLAPIDDQLQRRRDLIKKALENSIPNFSSKTFEQLQKKKFGSKFSGTMVKNFKAGFIHTPLRTDGSLHSDGRFHRTEWAHRCFYLAPNEEVVCAECKINPFKVKSPRVNVWVTLSLANVFNVPELTPKYSFLRLISIEPWEWVNTETISFTQFFGNFISSMGYSGIVYQSARMNDPLIENICVFPQNMIKGDFIQVIDPDGVYSQLHTKQENLIISV